MWASARQLAIPTASQSLPLVPKGRWHGKAVTEGIRTTDHREPYGDRQCPTTPPSWPKAMTPPLTQGSLFCAARRRVHIASARQRIRCAARATDSRPYGSEAHFFPLHSYLFPQSPPQRRRRRRGGNRADVGIRPYEVCAAAASGSGRHNKRDCRKMQQSR